MTLRHRSAALGVAGAAALALAACATAPVADPMQSSLVMGDAAAHGFDPAGIEAARAGIQAAIDEKKIPGGVLVVTRGGEVAMMIALGTEGPDDPDPMNEETIVRIYSMTKPIVSVATMTLVEEGVLNLDDPVSDYIPAYATLTVEQPEGEPVPAQNVMTIRQLLSHSSGLIYGIFAPNTELGQAYIAAGASDRNLSALEISNRIAALPLAFEPGAEWRYSRSTDVLGAVLEAVTGQSLDVILEERIFTPLGMDDTGFFIDETQADRLSQAYYGDLIDPLTPVALLSGGGGLVSTTEDYLRFALMLQNKGEYRGVRIIEPETYDLMTADVHLTDSARETFRRPGSFGLGFWLRPLDPADPNSSVVHTWNGVAGTNFWIDQDNDITGVYMIQARGVPGGVGFDSSAAAYEAFDGD